MILQPSRYLSLSLSLLLGIVCTTSLTNAQTPVPVPDNDFEEIFNPGWTTFGNAIQGENNESVRELINTPEIGDQSLKIFGNFPGDNSVNYGGAYQDILVDGTILKVGDLVQLDGFAATPASDSIIGTANDAYLELTYISNGTVEGLPLGDEFG